MSIDCLGEFCSLQSISPDHAYLLGSESLPGNSNIVFTYFHRGRMLYTTMYSVRQQVAGKPLINCIYLELEEG